MSGTCAKLRPALSAYLDDELEPGRAGALMHHLETCADCAAWLGAYRELSHRLGELPAPMPAPELGLRLRIVASRQGRKGWRWGRWRLRWTEAIRTWAVPAAVGTAAALATLTVLAGSVGLPNVNTSLEPDVVLSYATPPQLASGGVNSLGAAVVVDAQIDATGHVYGYSVVDGPSNPEMIERLNNQLLLSIFQPATTVFGQPTTGSVLVSFETVNVRG